MLFNPEASDDEKEAARWNFACHQIAHPEWISLLKKFRGHWYFNGHILQHSWREKDGAMLVRHGERLVDAVEFLGRFGESLVA